MCTMFLYIFIKGRVFHFYHFCEEGHQEMMKIPVTISKRCISISHLSKIKRGFGKFCVFKQGIPQHPQHSDSYLCTWAMWSRSECVGCFVFSNFCLSLWVLIMPKWLIHDSGRIAICFGHVWNFQMWTNIDPRTPWILQKYFNDIRTDERVLKHIVFHKAGNLNCWKHEVLKTNVPTRLWKYENKKVWHPNLQVKTKPTKHNT